MCATSRSSGSRRRHLRGQAAWGSARMIRQGPVAVRGRRNALEKFGGVVPKAVSVCPASLTLASWPIASSSARVAQDLRHVHGGPEWAAAATAAADRRGLSPRDAYLPPGLYPATSLHATPAPRVDAPCRRFDRRRDQSIRGQGGAGDVELRRNRQRSEVEKRIVCAARTAHDHRCRRVYRRSGGPRRSLPRPNAPHFEHAEHGYALAPRRRPSGRRSCALCRPR